MMAMNLCDWYESCKFLSHTAANLGTQSDGEIAGCISDIGVPFSPDDLQKPQPAMIQKVFEWFAELLMNTTRETVEPAMREAAKDVCGEDLMDIIPVETRNLMGFYASLRKLLVECGITDFTFTDLTKPTHQRLVKIFSYIINFVRFRESQTSTIDTHFNKLESTKASIEHLYNENTTLAQRLETLKAQRSSQENAVREKTARNNQLKESLLELKKAQERVATDMERVKRVKSELTSTLETLTQQTLTTRQESSLLQPYANQSSAALQTQLNELTAALSRDRATADSLSKRHRALATTSSTFSLAAAKELEPAIRLLESTSQDLADAEAESVDAARRRDQLAERSNSIREVEHTEAALQRQWTRWIERTETLRKNEKDRAVRDGERMRQLNAEYQRLGIEQTERGREVERRRVKVEQTEKRMADLKERIEAEIHAVTDEYQKMEAHVRLYVAEMEQAIVV